MAGAAVVLAGACAHVAYQPKPLDPAGSAAAFDQRSLEDPALRSFLTDHVGAAIAQAPTAAWDFDTLTWVAFYYHPALATARAQWAMAQAAVQTAGARPNPTLAVTPGYSTNAGAAVSPWLPAVTLDLPLETARKRGHRITISQHAAEASRQAVFMAAWKVRHDLRVALLELALASIRAEHSQALVTLQQQISARLARQWEAGAVAAPDAATARLEAVRAEVAANEAERQASLARIAVASALGLPASAIAHVSLRAAVPVDHWSAAQLPAARSAALRLRPDVVAALARYAAAESSLALEVARQYPDVHLGPGYQWDQGQNKWTLGFTLELPLWSRAAGPIAEAEARRREAAAQFVATQAQVIAEIDLAVGAQAAAERQLVALRQASNELQTQRQQARAAAGLGASDALAADRTAVASELGALAVAEAELQVAAAAGQLEDALQIPFAGLASLGIATARAEPSPP